MDHGIRFRGYLTFEDSLRVKRAAGPRRIRPAGWVTVGVLAASALILSRMQVDLVPAFLLLGFLGTFMAVGYRLMTASAHRSQQALYEKACIKRNGILKPQGIVIKRGGDRQTIPWAYFERVVAIEGVVALVKQVEILGFARYMFNTESEWRRARDLILSRDT